MNEMMDWNGMLMENEIPPVEKYSSGYYRVLLWRSGEDTLCCGWQLNMLGARLAGFTYMGQAEHVSIRVYQNTKFYSNIN